LRSTTTQILSNRSQSFMSNWGVWKFGQFSSASPNWPHFFVRYEACSCRWCQKFEFKDISGPFLAHRIKCYTQFAYETCSMLAESLIANTNSFIRCLSLESIKPTFHWWKTGIHCTSCESHWSWT
jgi:hypothetical protein